MLASLLTNIVPIRAWFFLEIPAVVDVRSGEVLFDGAEARWSAAAVPEVSD